MNSATQQPALRLVCSAYYPRILPVAMMPFRENRWVGLYTYHHSPAIKPSINQPTKRKKTSIAGRTHQGFVSSAVLPTASAHALAACAGSAPGSVPGLLASQRVRALTSWGWVPPKRVKCDHI